MIDLIAQETADVPGADRPAGDDLLELSERAVKLKERSAGALSGHPRGDYVAYRRAVHDVCRGRRNRIAYKGG